MRHDGLKSVLAARRTLLVNGPVAIVMAEDAVEVASTVRHLSDRGFGTVILLALPDLPVASEVEARVHRVDCDVHAEDALPHAVNRLIEAAPGTWFHTCYNAEYLFYPFCETRSVGEMLAFHAEERRDAMLSYVVDLYAGDLARFPDAVSLTDAHIDRTGYYALSRPDPADPSRTRDRQLDFFGGLRWRFEEHVPEARRKIDRIALFRAKPGLRLRADYTFSDEEYNTYACPWHHNLTSVMASFRAAKALATNPASRFDIADFRWRNSVAFDWTSRQLLDLGLMEQGQWF